MKKLVALILSIVLVGNVLAATDEAGIDKKQVEKLKEKVEQQTEKLKGKLEKVISGFIKETIDQGFVLEEAGEVKVDEQLTRYFKISRGRLTEIEKTDFEKGDYIFAVGPELEGNVNVLELYKDERYRVLSGIVVEVNKKEYLLRILTELKTEKFVDIERKTRQLILVKDKEGNFEFSRTRFSKIKENDYIIFVYKQAQGKEEERVSVDKVLIIPQEFIEGLRADKVK